LLVLLGGDGLMTRKDLKTTIGELLDRQHDQLLEWQSILKLEVYKEVLKEVERRTPSYSIEEQAQIADKEFDDIPRGNDIDQIVHTMLIGCKFEPELRKFFKRPQAKS
jgi:alkyl hydroperoxide reductase subunit AhpF